MLAGAPAVAALVGTRIYWNALPQAVVDPCVVIYEIDAIPEYTMDGPDGLASARVQIDCRGTTYASALGVARAIRAKLSGFKGAQGGTGFLGVFQISGRAYSEKSDTQLYHIVSTDYDVWFVTA